MTKFRFRCKNSGKACDYEVNSSSKDEVMDHASAHANRFHDMKDATSVMDLVNRSLEEVEDYND